MKNLTKILEQIDNIVWGLPLIILIMVTGIILTIRLRGIQVRHLGKAVKYMVKNEEDGEATTAGVKQFYEELNKYGPTDDVVVIEGRLVE